MRPPEFPAPFVIERTRSLGFGTGPWSREALVQAWGAPTADKYVAEAKAAGWLVSPARGVYHVPSAEDAMRVSWLPEPARTEFLVSRTLAAADVRAWCLSAWCRDNGLLFAEPIFVTDLAPPSVATRAQFERRGLQARALDAAEAHPTLPFLDNLVIVPSMPATADAVPRVAMVPGSSESQDKRRRGPDRKRLGAGLAGIFAGEADTALRKTKSRDASNRGIAYVVDGAIVDDAWITALLASIGTSRIEEFVTKTLKPKMKGRAEAVQRWAGLFGPPQPAAAWNRTLRDGPFPYLLVPPSLWAELGADQAARRYRMLDLLARA